MTERSTARRTHLRRADSERRGQLAHGDVLREINDDLLLLVEVHLRQSATQTSKTGKPSDVPDSHSSAAKRFSSKTPDER